MSTNALWAVQKAIQAALGADPALASLLGSPVRLYDDVPPQPQFPFASWDRARMVPLKADRAGALEHRLTLKIWSRYGGRREALEILQAVRAVLDDAALGLDGHVLVSLSTVFADVFRIRSTQVFEAILSLRAVTEPTP